MKYNNVTFRKVKTERNALGTFEYIKIWNKGRYLGKVRTFNQGKNGYGCKIVHDCTPFDSWEGETELEKILRSDNSFRSEISKAAAK